MIETKNIKASKGKNVDAIYIHIPFCSKKCEYCDFCTFIRMEKEYRKYTDYLIKEIRMYPKIKYDTIYFGGGTPSLLPTEMINEILNELDWSENAEITLELNPTDMTFEKLKKFRKIGINRLSIGIQSFQDHVLKFIGRQHSSKDAVNIYKMARKAGFLNITVDLMFGIPNQSIEDLQRDLNILQELKPENVSIYSLIWEEGTVFWSKLQKGILSEIDQDLEALMYEKIIDFFEKNGYCQYEISNFARIDDKDVEIYEMANFEDLKKLQKNAGRHNLKYWQNQKFIGVGMSAASYFDNNRYSNIRTFEKYYNLIDEKNLPIDENTVEIVDEVESEKLKKMLGLRLIQEGIEYFEDEKIEKLIENGLLEKFIIEKDNFINKKNKEFEKNECFDKNLAKNFYETRIRLTKKGMLLANNVFVEFI